MTLAGNLESLTLTSGSGDAASSILHLLHSGVLLCPCLKRLAVTGPIIKILLVGLARAKLDELVLHPVGNLDVFAFQLAITALGPRLERLEYLLQGNKTDNSLSQTLPAVNFATLKSLTVCAFPGATHILPFVLPCSQIKHLLMTSSKPLKAQVCTRWDICRQTQSTDVHLGPSGPLTLRVVYTCPGAFTCHAPNQIPIRSNSSKSASTGKSFDKSCPSLSRRAHTSTCSGQTALSDCKL